jgi:hypothetical protein
METTELIRLLEQVKKNIYERRMMDSIRTLTLIINNLKIENGGQENENRKF